MISGMKIKFFRATNFIKKIIIYFHLVIIQNFIKNRFIKVYARKEVSYKDILKTCDIGLSTVILKKHYKKIYFQISKHKKIFQHGLK